MAIFDVMFEFCDAEPMFADDTTFAADKAIDMQDTDLEMGVGEPIYLNIKFTTIFDGGTHIQFHLVSDTDTGFDSNSTYHMSTPIFAVADTTAGEWAYRGPIPYDIDSEQYIGLLATNTGTNTQGAVDAWLDHGSQSSYDTQVSPSNV